MPPLSKIQDLIGKVFNVGKSSLDVSVQDQTTTMFDFYFVNIQSTPTTLLSAITTVDPTTFVYTFDVVESADMSVGDLIGIFKDSTIERFFFAEILVISQPTGNATITVNTPLDFNFPAGSTVAAFNRNMNADGSSTPVIYQVEIGPASDEFIHINRIMMQMETSTAISLDKFGNLASLTNGIIFRIVNSEDIIQNIWTIKNNAEFALHAYDWMPYAANNPIFGQDGMSWRYSISGPSKHGVVIELQPGDKLQVVIQDDLNSAQSSAQITEFFMLAEGHFVDM